VKLIWEKFKSRGLEANRLVRFIDATGSHRAVCHMHDREAYAIWLGPLWSPEREAAWRRERACFVVKLWRSVTERRQLRAAPEGTQPLLS